MDSVRIRTASRWLPTAIGGLAWLASLTGSAARVRGDAAQPVDAMVFVRVVGDVRIVPRYDGAAAPVVRKNVEVATGSGFVVAPSGLVLTSRHVVDVGFERREGDDAEATVENQRIEVFVGSAGAVGAWEAHVVASDAENDLAALQLTAADLPYLGLGDSDAVEAGRGVSVLGFPYGRQTEVARRGDADVVPQVTVTRGALSASRQDEAGDTRFLQTDATMLPGNSGGPMLDEDGYVVGVVRMKLAADAGSSGAGFTVPVNVVKDFLDANGLLDRLPVTRLRPGVRHTLDWKGIAVELPEGFGDRSPARILADAGELGEVAFHAFRWESPWPVSGLEEALLGGQAVPGFIPAAATPGPRPAVERRPPGAGAEKFASFAGTGTGTDASGRRFRVELAIVDLGREKVVARYLGPADAVAFNLGLIRRSLRSLSAAPMLVVPQEHSAAAGPDAALEFAGFPIGEGGVVLPRSWPREPAQEAACGALPVAEAGLLVRHPTDYTIVMRALRLGQDAASLARAVHDCDAARGRDGVRYGFRFDRLGVAVAVRGVIVARGRESLLLELETPVAKLPVVEELYTRWVAAIAEPRSARYPVP
jgi:S1-C subfamily serine protease